MNMLAQSRRAARQRGSFLLESLIAVLIVAFAILGSIGLVARSMQNVDDAKFRGEAAFLANSLVGQMWVSDRTTANLVANFDDGALGAGYIEFKTMVDQRLPNAASYTQKVTVTPGLTPTSSNVVITITWQPPGDTAPHQYQSAATIGSN